MKRLIPLLALIACGPKPTPAPIPVLPGDGDTNVVKPPVDTKPAVNDPWAGKPDLIPPPTAKAPSAVELPAIESFKLANGLQVHVIKRDRLPIVSMQIAVRAGRMHEPQARLGVAEIAGDMLVKGTKRRDALAIARTIDFVGGTISADATYEATLLSCSVLARNLPTCLELMPEMLTQPAFPEPELQRVREQAVGAIRQRMDDASSLAAIHVQNLLWGDSHVRGWVTNEQSVMAIQREDLLAWHKAWFVPANAMLVVTGDVDPKKLKGDLERAFGGWAKGPVPPAPSFKDLGLSGSRIRLVDKPGQTMTHIRIAQFGIRHDDPRFFDTLVWNYALGGSLQSRLFKAMRADLTRIPATSSFDRNLDKGSFVAATSTRSQEAVAAAKILLSEIAKLAKDGPTEDEVTAAVANVAGGYGLRFQGAADLGAALIGAELHGFGREYLQNYPTAVGKVDVASAKRAAAEILDPKAFVMVLVGDAKDLEPQLKAAGWKYQKVAFTEPVNAPVIEPDRPIDPKDAAAAKALIDEALLAKGGRAKLAALKGFKMIAAGTTTIQGKTVPVEIERVFQLPDKMRIDALLAGRVKVVVAVDGKKGWQLAPGQSGAKQELNEIGGPDMASIDFERWREPELILLKASEPNARITIAPDATMSKHADPSLDGKAHSVVKLRTPQGIDIFLYFHKQTKLLSRLAYTEGPVSETDDFSDYRDVKGIKVAHKRNSSGGPRTTKLDLKSVVFDPAVDAKLFDKPPAP